MIYHIFANRSNAGDWLSAQGIQKLLEPLLVRELLCDTPFVNQTMRALTKASDEDFIVIGGGGLFMNYFMPFWKNFLKVADRIPFCIWGTGVCALKHKKSSSLSASMIDSIAKKSRLFAVRDEFTLNMLTARTRKLPHILDPVTCPSMVVLSQPEEKARGILHVNNYTTVGAATYRKMRTGGMEFARKSDRMFRETNNRLESDSKPGLEHILKRYRLSDLVVSSALHGCIISVAMGRRVLAVSNDWKIDAFMKTAGLGDWVMEPINIDAFMSRLSCLDEQKIPTNFLSRTRKENIFIAEKVKDLLHG